MKILILSILTIAMTTIGMAQNIYYVSLTGNDSNSGLTPLASWRTITYAASSASPVSSGDTVYIKAGDYGDENVVFETDGTAGNQITFEGYKSVPGDNPDLEWEYGDSLNANVMPLLDGGDRTIGLALKLNSRKYINVNNFQIRNYRKGVYAWDGHNLKINNIIAMDFGDADEFYNGRGIVFGSLASNNTIENCVVFNGAAVGIVVIGDGHIIKNCRVYSDDDSTGPYSSMDYYINVTGNDNIIENCYAERVGNLKHFGHGIGLKGECQNNIIRNCVVKNFGFTGFKVRHRGCKYNLFENCTAIGCGYSVRDGASYNTFRNCISVDSKGGVYFSDTAEDEGAQYAGRHNIFENCIFRNMQENFIDFFYYDEVTIADSNTFVNCVFDGGNYLFNADRENKDNKMVNCIVTNVKNYYRTQQYQDSAYSINFDFEYSDFWNNGFDAPTGVNISTFDPDFVDILNNDYHLKSTSFCIDAGTSAGAPLADFDGVIRPQGSGIDIGPYEYSPPSGIDDFSAARFLIYPNPTTNQITIQGAESALMDIKLYNMLGQDVTNVTKIIVVDATSVMVDLTKLNTGMYLVKTKFISDRIYKY